MASGVQDITCVFVEVAGSYEKNFQCPGMVCSPPVVLVRLTGGWTLFTLHYIKFFFFLHTVGNYFLL